MNISAPSESPSCCLNLPSCFLLLRRNSSPRWKRICWQTAATRRLSSTTNSRLLTDIIDSASARRMRSPTEWWCFLLRISWRRNSGRSIRRKAGATSTSGNSARSRSGSSPILRRGLRLICRNIMGISSIVALRQYFQRSTRNPSIPAKSSRKPSGWASARWAR